MMGRRSRSLERFQKLVEGLSSVEILQNELEILLHRLEECMKIAKVLPRGRYLNFHYTTKTKVTARRTYSYEYVVIYNPYDYDESPIFIPIQFADLAEKVVKAYNALYDLERHLEIAYEGIKALVDLLNSSSGSRKKKKVIL